LNGSEGSAGVHARKLVKKTNRGGGREIHLLSLAMGPGREKVD